MLKLLRFLVFLIIQIPFIPVAIIGFIPMMYKEIKISKKLRVSWTAGKVIQIRWILHYFGVREDKATIKFTKAFPCESHFGLLCYMGASIIANRICGFKPSFAFIPESGKETAMTFGNARLKYFDKSLEKNLDQVEQVVNMGAGYDLRAYKYIAGKNVKVFELDQEKTQNLKIETMKKAGIKYDWINYIPVDFREESWVEKLIENGFDQTKKTYFLWEGVSVYLEEVVAKDTLKKMATISAKGSIIAQDFPSIAFIKGETSYSIKKAKNMFKKMGEPHLFAIDMSEDAGKSIEILLQECGFKLKNLILFGEKVKTNKPFLAVTEAVKE